MAAVQHRRVILAYFLVVLLALLGMRVATAGGPAGSAPPAESVKVGLR